MRKTKTNLGPGQYNLDKVEAFPVYKFKPSSMFVSKVERVNPRRELKKSRKTQSVQDMLRQAMKPAIEDDTDTDSSDDNGVPGPGYYQNINQQSDFYVEPIPERLQFFGSTSD